MDTEPAATRSFDRMRSMLVRAAEIRDSEQQQVFDALDEIHARLAPLESLGSVRKRLSDLPDRTEVAVLAERLDEAVAKLDAQDAALAGLGRAVEALVDRLARPFAELGGRLDGVAGRFEGVAGRMGGLEDRIAGVHQRIDDLDHHLDRLDGRLDGLPSAVHGPVRERVDALDAGLRGRLDEVDEGVHEHLDSTRDAVAGLLASTRDELAGSVAQHDPADRVDALAGRVERLHELLGAAASRLDALDAGVGRRPDTAEVEALVRTAARESEGRQAGQLDEAMATFAELIMGGAPGQLVAAPPPPPRPAQRRVRTPPAHEVDPPDDGPAVAAS